MDGAVYPLPGKLIVHVGELLGDFNYIQAFYFPRFLSLSRTVKHAMGPFVKPDLSVVVLSCGNLPAPYAFEINCVKLWKKK